MHGLVQAERENATSRQCEKAKLQQSDTLSLSYLHVLAFSPRKSKNEKIRHDDFMFRIVARRLSFLSHFRLVNKKMQEYETTAKFCFVVILCFRIFVAKKRKYDMA